MMVQAPFYLIELGFFARSGMLWIIRVGATAVNFGIVAF